MMNQSVTWRMRNVWYARLRIGREAMPIILSRGQCVCQPSAAQSSSIEKAAYRRKHEKAMGGGKRASASARGKGEQLGVVDAPAQPQPM